MTNDEIREAISATKEIAKWLDGDANGRHYNILVALAEDYLKAEGWPEELDETDYAGVCSPCVVAKDYRNVSFNEALRLCKLAAMKERPRVSEEEIEKILETVLMKHCDALGEQDDYAIGMATDALLELINGKEA